MIDIAQRLGLTRLLWVFAPAVSNRLAWSPELAAVVDATYGDHLLSYNCVIGGLRKLTEVDPVPHGLDDSIWSPGGWPDRAYMRETMLPLAGRLAGTDGDVLDVGYMAFNADDAKLAHLLPERWFSVDPLPHAIDENRSGRLLIGTVAELAQQMARRFAVIIEYGVLGCRGLQGGLVSPDEPFISTFFEENVAHGCAHTHAATRPGRPRVPPRLQGRLQ